MPYFKTNNTNILFIHIPKTGGSSVDFYFADKFGKKLNRESLYSELLCDEMEQLGITSSLQHMTYSQVMRNKSFFNIDVNNLTVIAVVRNPYERILSSLFFQSKISKNPSQKEVECAILSFLGDQNTDNHNLPQYKFITDENKKIIPNAVILKTDGLTEQMRGMGFTDFDMVVNKNRHGVTDYVGLLSAESVRMVNEFYCDDFEVFGFEKIV